ncbi:efflux transporter outer membrane subunit [Silvibacterium dinghuense]|uniref:Efflux transporter outer membrane subunit n=1 Tax=Silvibacterium dinghuense TaxID=1560006 RepID=A0A4Q1S8Z1_9BACT|nr:efflux transporter outer membrane subunit [Silvibacterium dinghuense]RXS93411.1 efflux transporter outer membrane subunit [Silvibacterium dinghuense]GGH05591.1 outer membrane efflux lipoprotein [Silvibacterium dinghuense]
MNARTPVQNSVRNSAQALLFKAAGAALLVALAGCNVGPKYQRASMPAPPAYKESQPGSPEAQATGWKQANPQDTMLRGKWWEIFGDSELNQLEESLLINDQNLKQYFQNYMAARAVVRSEHASLFPSLTAGPSYSREGTGSGSTAKLESSSGSTSTELAGSVSWEPDLWGSVRNTLRADQNAAQVSAADLANETLSEQSSLAQYYFELRGEDALQQVYDNTAASYKQYLELTKTLRQSGIDTDEDVAEAETNLRSAEASAVAVGITRAQYEHAIALLLGKPASSFSMPVRPLDAKLPYIPTGVPSQLLERRPDIAAAERTMAEANAYIGVQKAAYYPTISLSGSAGTQSSDITQLLGWPARFWSLGASASETLLDWGQRKANVQNYQAQYNADVASYRQTVLTAFKEVEDYLVSCRMLSEQIQKQQLAVDSAQRYQDIATTRYKSGVDTYLNVLTAQNTLLTNRQSLATLQMNQMVSAVELIAALGGGWDTSQLPTVSEVTKKP